MEHIEILEEYANSQGIDVIEVVDLYYERSDNSHGIEYIDSFGFQRDLEINYTKLFSWLLDNDKYTITRNTEEVS